MTKPLRTLDGLRPHEAVEALLWGHLPAYRDETPPDELCQCGHARSEHRETLPAPCYHGNTNLLASNPEQPGYGCTCIGFSPSAS
jgi:hypothetical protein